MRRSFIAWNDFSETKPEKTGREYLVTVPAGISAKEADIKICKYYKKGDKVEILMKEGTFQKLETKEDQLLYALGMIGHRQVVIPKDGFYYKEATLNGTYKNTCCEDIIPMDAEPLYWAELPMQPDGYEHPYDTADKINEVRELSQQESRKKSETAFTELIKNNPYAAPWIDTAKTVPDTDQAAQDGLIYRPDLITRMEAFAITGILCSAYRWIQENVSLEEQEAVLNADEGDNESAVKLYNKISSYIDGLIKDYDMPWNITSTIKRLILHLCLFPQIPKNFKYFGQKAASKSAYSHFKLINSGVFSDLVLSAVLARILNNAYCQLKRIFKLEKAISDPKIKELVVQSEVLNLAEQMILFTSELVGPVTPEFAKEYYGNNESPFGGRHDFEASFGFTTDGIFCELDPYIDNPPIAKDDNGKFYCPAEGRSEAGDIVKFHARKFMWEPGEICFYKKEYQKDEDGKTVVIEGEKYEIISVHKFASDGNISEK